VKRTLDNGLRVIIEARPSSPVVALQLWVQAGSADESDAESGLAHVHEHMLFKGTERRGVGEIAGDIEAAGGDINAWTSLDQTVFHVVISSRWWKRGLDVLADAVMAPRFDSEELEKEREVILEELRSALDVPSRQVSRRLFEQAFEGHPYARPVLGVPETLATFDRDDVLAFYRKWYRPENVILTVAGGVKVDEVLGEVDRLLGDWSGAGDGAARSVEPVKLRGELKVIVSKDAISEVHLALGFAVPEASHADVPALDVLSIVLGQGESCRLNQEVRRKRELVSGVQAFAYTPRQPGLMMVSATTQPDRVEEAVAGLLDEVFRLRHERVPADELAKARTMVEADTVFQRETVEGAARRMGYWESVAGDPDAEHTYLNLVRQVGPDDLLRVARSYLIPDRLTVSALIPKDGPSLTEGQLAKAVEASEERVAARYAAETPAPTEGELVEVTLDNGLRLLVIEDRAVPVVAMRAVWPGGLRYETKENAGIHNFLAELLTLGTADRSAEELAKAIDVLAGSITGFSGRNSFGLAGEFLARDFRQGLELFGACMLSPTFPSDEVDKTRTLLLEDVRVQEDNPSGIAFRTFGRELFGEHPYHLDVLGTMDSLSRMDAGALREHFDRHFPPGAATLVVVGAVEPAEVVREVRRHFEADRRKAAPPPPLVAWPVPDKARDLVRIKDRAQAHIVMGFAGTTINSQDRFALEVLSTLLGGQGGRLFLELRERRGLVYSVTSINLEGVEPGYFAVYAATAPEKVADAVAAIESVLRSLVSSPPSAEDLQRARRYLIGANDIGMQRIGAVASTVAFDAAFGLGALSWRDHAERIEAVTAEQVQAAARRYLDLSRRLLVVVGPEGTTMPEARPILADGEASIQ
jgi:zinc protease